ncbi:MAG: glycosyltransferase, partial [Chloroflexota bacterium]|nr:glycosyltransferase [Chloroflexota bacterium]
SSPATRLPGPYLVGADSRSIDDESIAAARWAKEILGADHRFAADRVNRLLLGSYGAQHVVFHGSDGVEQWQVLLSPQIGAVQIARLQLGEVEFVLIDRRLSWSLPLVPFYYEEGEIFEGRHTTPISAQVLAKWDRTAGVDRVYDSGHIQIYHVGGLYGTP